MNTPWSATLRIAAAPAGRHLCRMTTKINRSSGRSGILRPDGALDLFGLRFYKYSAPDGALACHFHAPLVDRILAAKQSRPVGRADVSALEREIDQLVYALYSLTPEEIQIVECAAK